MMLSKQGPIRRTHPQLHMTVAVDRTVAVIPARTSEPGRLTSCRAGWYTHPCVRSYCRTLAATHNDAVTCVRFSVHEEDQTAQRMSLGRLYVTNPIHLETPIVMDKDGKDREIWSVRLL